MYCYILCAFRDSLLTKSSLNQKCRVVKRCVCLYVVFDNMKSSLTDATQILKSIYNFKVRHYLATGKDWISVIKKPVCSSLHVQGKIFAECFKAFLCCRIACKTEVVIVINRWVPERCICRHHGYFFSKLSWKTVFKGKIWTDV